MKAAIVIPSLIVGILLLGMTGLNVFAASHGITNSASVSNVTVDNHPHHHHPPPCNDHDKDDKHNDHDHDRDDRSCHHHTTSSTEIPSLTLTPTAKSNQ